ncbi:MAG: hypothetical protein IT364_05100 [Candidatus Hydrogenedentes bacterium]|nr:hypothetical protein [Candidatus Hydrogenedentota bacterium]
MNLLLLPARYDAENAARIFRRPRALNLFGLLRSRPVKRAPNGKPASLELVWMPVYVFRMQLSRGEKRSDTWVSVDASFGGFALFDRLGVLEERVPEGEVFDPVITEEAAERIARSELVRYILRRRGAKPNIDGVAEHRLYHTPVWVYYFRRFGTKIDLAVLDGYTGEKMGSRMRIAILEGFIRRRKERLAQAGHE